MAKFKKGDRVRNLVQDRWIKYGAKGTVDEDDSQVPFVKWDSYDMIYLKSSLTWARNEEYLELIES